MKTIVRTALISVTLAASAPSIAETMRIAPQAVASAPVALSIADRDALFRSTAGTSTTIVLDRQEMRDTEGAFLPIIVRVGGGAVLGGGAALGHHFVNGGNWGNVNWTNVGYAAGVGAVGGGWGRLMKIRNY